jgi:1-deoxy-D-xylulose-5-phosphate synthase
LWTAIEYEDGPFAFRYPRGQVPEGWDPHHTPKTFQIGSWEMLQEGAEVAILAVGSMVQEALLASERLALRGIRATLVNARFIKPVDETMIRQLRASHSLLVTVEENTLVGGFGAGVVEFLEESGSEKDPFLRVALPDHFVTHGSREQLLDLVGLSAEHLESKIINALG